MKKFNIWMEGYQVAEGHGTAKFLGTYFENTFSDACRKAAEDNLRHDEYDRFDPEDNSIWGCRLFDNEIDARESFG